MTTHRTMTLMRQNMVRIVLLCMVMLCGGGSVWGQTAATLANGDYFIRNVETGLFLNGANDWGTKASATLHGQKVTLTRQNDGKYTIDSHIANNASNHYLAAGDNTYIDGGVANHTIEEVATGVYTIKDTNGKYLFNNNENRINFNGDDATNNRARWQILSKGELIQALTDATSEDPVDATFLIGDPNFSRNNQHFTQWQGGPAKGGDNTNMNAEAFNKAFDVYQEITGIPNGTYRFKAQGFYRNGLAENAATTEGTYEMPAHFYANDVEVAVPSIFQDNSGMRSGDGYLNTSRGYIPNTQATASAAFTQGLYQIESGDIVVTNGKLRIGVKKTVAADPANNWTIFDNFELYCYGGVTEDGLALLEKTEEYNNALSAAKAINQSRPMDAAVLAALQSAISTYSEDNVLTGSETVASLETATAALQQATEDALASIVEFAGEAPIVTMTFVNANDPDASYGELTSVSTGFNKISNGSVEAGNMSWGINNLAYIKVDASKTNGVITKATLKGTFQQISARGLWYGVGYNASEWSPTLTWNTADRSITLIDGTGVSCDRSNDDRQGELDITAAFKNDDDKIVTILVYQTAAGGGNIKDVSVEIEFVPESQIRDYTVNYTFEGNVIKTDEGRNIPGEEINAVSPLFVDDVKYYATDDAVTSMTITSDGTNVLNVPLRKARQFNYRVTSNLGTIIREDSGTEGEDLTVSYPKYILDEETHKLYTLDPMLSENKQYAVMFNLNEDNYVHTLEYTETDIDNVVRLIEAEDIEGLTFTNYVGNGTRTSMGGCAYPATETLLMTGLPTGKYELVAFFYNNTSDGSVHTLNAKIGEITIWEYSTNATGLRWHTSEPFGIADESIAITLPQQGNQSVAFDFFYIRRVGEFEGIPTITQNLKATNKVELESALPLRVTAENAAMYRWYKWNGTTAQYDPENPDLSKAEVIDNTNNNIYLYRGTTKGTESFFCQVIGYGTSAFSNLASIETIDKLVDGAAMTIVKFIDYENTTTSDWTGSGDNSIASHTAVVANTERKGNRSSWLDLAHVFDNAPSSQDGTWTLDYDFSPGAVNEVPSQGYAIYSAAVGLPTSLYNYAPEATRVFFGLNAPTANVDDYDAYVGGVRKGQVSLTPDQWYHVHLQVTNTTMHVELTDATGRATLFTGDSDTPFDDGMALGGILHYIPRYAGATHYDNITVQVLTSQPMVNSDLPEFLEGNDDYYLNEGDGLNFDVPAATEFEWYVSDVAPSKNADGVDAPKLEDDGSVTWTNGTAFMTVTSPVGRGTTTITKTNGDELSASGKHSVAPAADNEGKYAMQLVAEYPTVKTVYDESVDLNGVRRYYPEATASGSRWHYLRQLDVQNAEADHLDYVWCVAKNPLGEVTSKITQINTYPMMPQIYLEDEYLTENANGARADMTLPAIYKFRTHGVKIHAVNLIFNTDEKPVPYATRSLIHYKDESLNTYEPTDEVAGPTTQWKYNDDIWSGVISTTTFTYFDETLNANASVHGFYKSIPVPLPVDFAYGLLQQKGMPYHDITKGTEHNSIAEYVIGPLDNVSLQATQDIHFDYGRYAADEVQLQPVSTKTVWDWSQLPERKFLTYNTSKYTTEEQRKNLYTVGGVKTYVVDPDTKLAGPEMGQQYVMANFYGYGVEELGGFPSDKVKIGLEYVNSPTDQCMQGNAFIIKPALTGQLELSFTTTDSGESRYLTLNYDDQTISYKSAGATTNFNRNQAINVTMTITADMVDKEVCIKACKSSDDTSDQYFRIYSATYLPDAAPVDFAEWTVKDRAVGLADEYEPMDLEHGKKSDGFVSLSTSTEGATIKYKIITRTDLDASALNAIAADIDNLDAEEQTYKDDVYTDSVVVDGIKQVQNKIGIHCPVNSTIFAWTEKENMNRSEVTWYKTNAAVYPVDMRFVSSAGGTDINSDINDQDKFDETYWDESGTVKQAGLPELIRTEGYGKIKDLTTTKAPKAWEEGAKEYGKAFIDGEEYNYKNFEDFYITHGTTIDLFVNPESEYEFAGWGAPSFSEAQGKVVDMMRSGEKAKHVHYHLLYDKAKAATTAGIAFLIAHFTDRTEALTAKMMMTRDDGTGTEYNINMVVLEGDKIIAPVYHSAHDADGMTVTHWTDDYGLADSEGTFEDYQPGEEKQIYEDTQIRAVYRKNEVADNYRGRSVPMHATWWFTTDHHAQPLSVRNEYAGFSMSYVTPVPRHEIGTAVDGADNDITFDFPLTITPTATGRIENTVVPDWCSVGRGTRFTMPACKDAVVQMEVRSRLSDAETGTKFGGETPQLVKVKVKRANTPEYYEVDDVNSVTLGDTIYSYTYEATYTGNDETLDVVIGSDYSYIRNISLTLPVIISKRDAALVTLDFAELAQHLDLVSLAGYDTFSYKPAPKPYNQGHTGDGYQFDHKSENISLYKTHYSGEDGAIYYDGVSPFKVLPGMGQEVPDSVPYVNGILGYTYSTGTPVQGNKISQTDDNGAFIVGPFRSITHIRYKQGSSLLEGGGWTMTIGRKNMNWDKSKIQKDDMINKADDPRRSIPDFSQVRWGDPKMGAFHNSTAPEWVEMDIEEHIHPDGKDNNDISLIKDDNYDNMDGDIWLRFQADKPNVYLLAIEIYGIASTSEQQVTLRTNNMVAANDDATDYEPTFIAGDIFHFPYLLHLDESYNPVSRLLDTEDKVLQFNEGLEVTLTANANTGYDFLKWVKLNEETEQWEEVSRENPYKFNINQSSNIRAVFVPRGIINYTAQGTRYGIVPEPVQTNRQGGFTVAENRSLFAAEGQSLRRWQDTEPMNDWYTGAGLGQSKTFAVSTNMVTGSTPSVINRSRGELGTQVDLSPEFSDNKLSLLDIVGRIGATARWQFGKKNNAPTMEGHGTTPRLVTQVSVTGKKDILDEENHTVNSETVTDIIDVSMEIHANVNNAGRADAYATVDNGALFTLPCTKGVKVEIGTSSTIQYSMDGGTTWTDYTGAFNIYKRDPSITLQLRNKNNTGDDGTMELEYIQATYHQRAQKPVLSMQNVDVIGDSEHHATNNVQVQVQTNSNPTAVRYYTIDGSDPTYIVEGNTVRPTGTTRQVRGNYITINEAQIGSGTTLKVLSVCSDRADSEIATLDLEQYDKDLGLATYVYDSRIINIHEDQIFQKLKAEHKGHFNLLSYDLNPAAAVIPDIITDHTTVFITSDAVVDHLMTALTNPSDPAAHGQTFNVEPLIVGTPLTVSWKQSANEGDWTPITWRNPSLDHENPATATSPATITYTEIMRSMKEAPTRDDNTQTYAEYYHDQIQAAGGQYVLAFYDGMLLDGSEVCISNTTDNAAEHLSANGTQLVFNATELLTRITEVDGVKTPADVSTFNSTVLALMAPSKNPQLIDVKMSYTNEVIDYRPDAEGWIAMDAPMLSALSDGLSTMKFSYLSKTYPQFVAGTIADKGQVKVTNVETYKGGDDIATAEKLGARGVKDLATIITVTNKQDEIAAGLDRDFKREYRIEYHIALDSLTFHKVGDQWVCDGDENCTITEEKNSNGEPMFKLLGPINSGIKDVCFNGYAVAPNEKFDSETGELLPDDDGQHNNTIWGRGEKFDNDDPRPSPTAHSVTGMFIPEYPENYDGEKTGLPEGQWMESHFPWGFENNYQMAFSLLNITDYVGEIKVRFYRQQADAPELIETNILNDMEVPANGDFVMKFNTIMHQVRKPGLYDDGTVTWAAHIIPDDLGGGIKYGDILEDDNRDRLIDEYDTHKVHIPLTAEGGTNTLTFQYWHLEEGKKYWLHIPFHILRSDVGNGLPYEYNAEGECEQQMSWTNYVGTDSKAVPYFDIPFTVKKTIYNHKVFNYIVDNDNWWDAYKEDGKAAPSLPTYAKWDGTFLNGIAEINKLSGRPEEHPRYYMHVQKLKDGGTYDLGKNLLQIKASNFSIVGEGQDSTIVTAEPDAYDVSDYRGLREDVTGNKTATLHLDASDVYMQGLTLQNTQPGHDEPGQEYPALFVHGDRNTFYDVNIEAYEESFASFGTLTYLDSCKVSGYGDFIVGGGDVWFEQCKILLRDKHMINLCASATKATEKWGFIFNDCHIDREEGAANVLDHNWTLAKPWGGYDEAEVLKSPAVTFLKTKLTVLPTNTGYGDPHTSGLRLRFHEYGTYKNNPDNPAPLSMRSVANCSPTYDSDYPVLTKEEADNYTIANVFGKDNDGYDPQALTRQAKAPVLTNDGMVLHWKANKEDLCYLVYYLGDGEEPDYQNAMMFCCVKGTDEVEAYCYLTDHNQSPIFRTAGTSKPTSFSELWYGKWNTGELDAKGDPIMEAIPGMGKEAPSRLWFAVRAANQMGGLSEMSEPLMYHAARQYRTNIKKGGVLKGDDSGNAFSTIYLDFQARAPQGVKAYALTDVSSDGGDGTGATTLTFTRVNDNDDYQDVVYPDQGYLIYGPYTDDVASAQESKVHVFVETTALPTVELTSHLSGTVGEFLNRVSEPGYGEQNGVNGEIGWSISDLDYKDVPRVNISAFTLQKYNDALGFYKFTGANFSHHRAYLNTDVAAEMLMKNEGMTKQDADRQLARGMRLIIRERDGSETDITPILMDEAEQHGVYDLMGRRIQPSAMQPGHIYIVDGKKVMR